MTLGAWIKLKFHSQELLNSALCLTKGRVNSYYNKDPKKLFMYVPQLSKFGDTSTSEIVKMIEQRCDDVKARKALDV